ncbi:SAM-dependent methyltransferase [Streptomyces sp. WMMB 322]|uniref:SAM-dependent methyltransferase n=1 Tax=Streptomyces sp. WMMB 322 TaxID=1286821 RepID=UPI0006E46CA9|nr:SAM-dependent methyltransferase [Streptomyces sp. WMMB 322]SCK40656.1 S-adenosyl methyltransferase [Streptomyces sp. WMMB 322]
MLTLGRLTAGVPPLLRWAGRGDAPGDPGSVVERISRCGPDGPPIGERTERVLFVTSPGSTLEWVRLRAENAAGVVVCGEFAHPDEVPDCGLVPVLTPLVPGGPVRVAEALTGAQIAVLQDEVRQVETYTDLAAHAMAEGRGPQGLLDWVSREARAQVEVVDGYREQDWPAEVSRHTPLLRELVRGREHGPVRGAGHGRYVEVWPVGVGPPHRLLIASRDEPWSGRGLFGLEQVAVMVAGLLREGEVTEREHRLHGAVQAARTSAFQYLMVGDVTSAGRAVEPLAPGLMAAGMVQLAVVEKAPGEEREAVAEEVEEALEWGRALTVLCPVDETQIIVVWDGAQAPVQTVLEPVAEADPDRAVGVSGRGPLEHAARLYSAAAVSVEAARRTPGGVAAHDGRPPLAELLGGSARAWARELLAPLERNLTAAERRRLLEVCGAAIAMGTQGAGRLLGLHRDTVTARLDELTERVNLDRSLLGDRAKLDLAMRLADLPPPVPETLPAGGVRQVLDQDGASAWGKGVLSGLPPRLLSALARWVGNELDREVTAQELGISGSTFGGWLREAGTFTHLPLRKDRPGAVHELLWALYTTGRVRPSTVTGSEGEPKPDGPHGNAQPPPAGIGQPRTDTPHPARLYDYFLGGRTNYAADRAAAQQAVDAAPATAAMARENRAFMLRAVRHLAGHEGIRQFLDLGAGIPTEPNLHQVVQAETPTARVVYVDDDPVVHAHAQALLTGSPLGRTSFLRADAADPSGVLASPEVLECLDMDQPVALSLVALLPFVTDDESAKEMIRGFTDALVPGSCLTLSHLTGDLDPEGMAAVCRQYEQIAGIRTKARSYAEVAALLDGLELLDPGIVLVHRWRSDRSESDLADDDPRVGSYGAVARIP